MTRFVKFGQWWIDPAAVTAWAVVQFGNTHVKVGDTSFEARGDDGVEMVARLKGEEPSKFGEGIDGGATYTRTVTVGDGAPAKTRGQEVAERLANLNIETYPVGNIQNLKLFGILIPPAFPLAIADDADNARYHAREIIGSAIDAELTTRDAAWSRALHLPPNIAWTPEAGGKHVAGQMEGVAAVASAEAAKSIESFADGMEYSASQYERTGARIEAMAMRDTQRSLRNAAKHLSPSNNPPR